MKLEIALRAGVLMLAVFGSSSQAQNNSTEDLSRVHDPYVYKRDDE